MTSTDELNTEEFRIEHDTMGEVRVPVNALYRAQTQRAVENFPISGKTLERAHIEALARVKKAAAQANAELGVLDGELAQAIADAADQVAAGKYDGDFPIDVFQTGSGTSSNMNTNEVIAELASRALKSAGSDKVVHPNDHVNASQSSNDVFPTSVHVAATSALINDLIPALGYLAESLERKAAEFKDVVKSGRTHLMDATPVTLGQEFGGYAAPGPLRHRAHQRRPPPRRRGPARRHRRGHRHQHAGRIPAARDRAARRRHRTAPDRGPRPLRGPGQPRRPRRGLRASCATSRSPS